ncbi:MAG: WbqC family protein [Dokdonia sp.]
MNTILIQPAYCGPIIQYAAMAQADTVVLEVFDNYQKQSYRNRMRIATATGQLTLTIPILHRSDSAQRHQLTQEVSIENQFKWQRNHWRSLKTAYQTSPYFEYYEDEFEPLYHTQWELLSDFHTACRAVILEALQLEVSINASTEYFKTPEQTDLRQLINCKREPNYPLLAYHQLFEDKHGYLKNLSILDLLFNQGPSALSYLEKIDLSGLG